MRGGNDVVWRDQRRPDPITDGLASGLACRCAGQQNKKDRSVVAPDSAWLRRSVSLIRSAFQPGQAGPATALPAVLTPRSIRT